MDKGYKSGGSSVAVVVILSGGSGIRLLLVMMGGNDIWVVSLFFNN